MCHGRHSPPSATRHVGLLACWHLCTCKGYDSSPQVLASSALDSDIACCLQLYLQYTGDPFQRPFACLSSSQGHLHVPVYMAESAMHAALSLTTHVQFTNTKPGSCFARKVLANTNLLPTCAIASGRRGLGVGYRTLSGPVY